MKNIFILFTIFLLFKTTNSYSAEILSSGAEYENDKFIIDVSSHLNTSTKSVFKILTDYDNIARLSPKIIQSRAIESSKRTAIVKTVVRGCVLFFCKEITNTQITRTNGRNKIESTTIPGMSDFAYGKMTWELRETEEGTIVDYHAEIEPDFFVPPVIGSYFIKKSMVQEAETLALKIEEIASESQMEQP